MPELPDIAAYIGALEPRIIGHPLKRVRLASAFLLRTAQPPLARVEGRYADKETNYCARCQTGGKVLADRGLSRLLGSDWPRTMDELEALTRH